MSFSPDFYKTKSLAEMSKEEWEALCDGCGNCCFQKIVTGYGKRKKVHFTRIACNLLDLKTRKCSDYCNRFTVAKNCVRLTKKNVGICDWLPETCAYRRLYYKQPLPTWHPLVTGRADSVKELGVLIQNGVHESDVDETEWKLYEISE